MRRSLLCVTFAVFVSGCATAGYSAIDVSPAEIPALERLVAEQPDAAAALLRLAIAYGAADRVAESRAALEHAVTLPDAPTSAWAYLGAVAERAADYAAAEHAYTRYLELGGRRARASVQSRLAYAQRQLLAEEARLALAREAELSMTPPQAGTIAVMQLVVTGPAEYQPLGRGLSEMLATDLSRTGRLQVLERARLDALLAEAQLGLAGFTDAATGARTGRLLRTERVVQGRLLIPEEGLIELRSVLVHSTTPDDIREARESGALDALLSVQLQLALSIYRELGIELTDTELARLLERPTDNLQAFLAYSRGLEAVDRGQYGEAAAQFQQAAQLDPSFQEASQAAADVEQQAGADVESLDALTAAASREAAEETAGTLSDMSGRVRPDAVRGTMDALVGAGGVDAMATRRVDPALSTERQAQVGESGSRTGTVIIRVQRPDAAVVGGHR